MLTSCTPRESTLSLSQAVAKGEEFLEKKGYKNMVPTGTIVEGNQLSLSFVRREEGVIMYPDLIKLTLALDNGEIVAFDALGYLMCHHQRDLPPPVLKAEEAEKMVCQQMEIQQTRLAVIPLGTWEERFCYEVRGKVNGDTYLVYINALTKEEEELLQLLGGPAPRPYDSQGAASSGCRPKPPPRCHLASGENFAYNGGK